MQDFSRFVPNVHFEQIPIKISYLIRNTSGHCLRLRLKKPSRIST